MKKNKTMKNTENKIDHLTWIIVIFGASYLAFSTGREAVHVWELWILTAAFVLIAAGGVVNLFKKGGAK